MPDFSKIPHAGWLENGLKTIVGSDPQCIILAAVQGDGQIMTGYWECSFAEKCLISDTIKADAMMDATLENIDVIRDALRDLDDDGDSEEDED